MTLPRGYDHVSTCRTNGGEVFDIGYRPSKKSDVRIECVVVCEGRVHIGFAHLRGSRLLLKVEINLPKGCLVFGAQTLNGIPVSAHPSNYFTWIPAAGDTVGETFARKTSNDTTHGAARKTFGKRQAPVCSTTIATTPPTLDMIFRAQRISSARDVARVRRAFAMLLHPDVINEDSGFHALLADYNSRLDQSEAALKTI